MSKSFDELIDLPILNKIDKLYHNLTKNDEFELMFFNYKQKNNTMSTINYLKILEYLSHKSRISKTPIIKTTSLDINFSNKSTRIAYRITINNIENINKYMEMLNNRKNHVIFNVLASIAMSKENTDSIQLIKKTKTVENTIDIDAFNIRIRVSEEIPLTKETKEDKEIIQSINENNIDDIVFRFKQRVSLQIADNTFIDLTKVNMAKTFDKLKKSPPIYELEIDHSPKTKSSDKTLDTIYSNTTTLLKIIQQSNYLIDSHTENEVLDYYTNLVSTKRELKSLAVTNTVTLEIQYVVEKLMNKYAVTDKADGVRANLIIYKDNVYIIDKNLHVSFTGINLPKTKYNGSLLDGELIFIKKENRHVFLAFNCLFSKGVDVRVNESLFERLAYADDIIDNCFILGKQKGFKFIEYNGKDFNPANIVEFYKEQQEAYMKALNHDIGVGGGERSGGAKGYGKGAGKGSTSPPFPLIRRKFFYKVYGIQDNEIFKYSELLWKTYNYDKSFSNPYLLDGLIYQPLNQKYTTVERETVYFEYKWKPPELNSIDFYITFQKDRNTGNQYVLYDNSNDEYVRNKPYKIAHLHVYITDKMGNHQPELFQKNDKDSTKYIAYLFLDDTGQVRDKEGNIIQDKTVVEFYYDTDITIPDKHRWVPIRTRHDKTEYVQKYNQQYGNYSDVANKNWRSISNPFLFDDIVSLSKDDVFKSHIEEIRSKIGASIILSERLENAYYQKTYNLAIPMKHFNDWMKTILYYTIFNGMMYEKKEFNILDLGTIGEDLMKYYYGRVGFYLGIDTNNNNLISPVNGTISRYKNFAATNPGFPQMVFIHADPSVLLNYDEQIKVLGSMSQENMNAMKKYFNPDTKPIFDRICYSNYFALMLENTVKWNNFLTNINMNLKKGGLMLIICMDSDKITELLKNTPKYTLNYTTKYGEELLFFEIKKMYPDPPPDIGAGIDVHFAKICQEGKYNTEYLVKKEFIVKEFNDKCKMDLIETGLFENQHMISRDFLFNAANYEHENKTKTFMNSINEYYDMKDNVNQVSFEMTKLYRFYIFKKREGKNKK